MHALVSFIRWLVCFSMGANTLRKTHPHNACQCKLRCDVVVRTPQRNVSCQGFADIEIDGQSAICQTSTRGEANRIHWTKIVRLGRSRLLKWNRKKLQPARMPLVTILEPTWCGEIELMKSASSRDSEIVRQGIKKNYSVSCKGPLENHCCQTVQKLSFTYFVYLDY